MFQNMLNAFLDKKVSNFAPCIPMLIEQTHFFLTRTLIHEVLYSITYLLTTYDC